MVRELQSRGFVYLWDEVEAMEPEGEEIEEADGSPVDMGIRVWSWEGGEAGLWGIVKVKEDCLRARFSVCNLDNKSLRFSFSEIAFSFFASRSATLSSNWTGEMRMRISGLGKEELILTSLTCFSFLSLNAL